MDENGGTGTITRTGTASSDGTRFTTRVPVQAVTGDVRVVGDSETQIPLQIVPRLRSVGGEIVAGNQIILEGTGLAEGDLIITIDGQQVTGQDTLTILDLRTNNSGNFAQQVVTLTVPSGVGAGLITVTTGGGSSTFTACLLYTSPSPRD